MKERFLTGPAGRFALASALTGLLAAAMIWLIGQHEREIQLQQQADGLGNALARQTAIMATELVLANDLISLNVLLDELTRDTPVARAEVLGVNDRVIASTTGPAVTADGSEPGDSNRYLAPIALQDSIAGYVRITLNPDLASEAAMIGPWMKLAALALVLTLSVSSTLLLYRHQVAVPLQTLGDRLRAMGYGRPRRCTASAAGEIGQLIDTYNQAVPDSTADIDVDTDVDAGLPADDAGGDPSTSRGTLLVLRIDNHERMQQYLAADDIADVENLFRRWLEQIATLYNGQPSQHADGWRFGLEFGRQAHDPDQVFHAICSALLFIRLSEQLPDYLGLPVYPQIRAGVHSTAESLSEDGPFLLADQLCMAAPVDSVVFSTAALEQAQSPERLEFEAYTRVTLPHSDDATDSWRLNRLAASGPRKLIERQASHLLHS